MHKKDWEIKVIEHIQKSLDDIPHELNELDWKEGLSPNNKKLTHHLSAFSNHPGGGFLLFGVNDKAKIIGINQEEVSDIVEILSSLARDSLEPCIKIDHTIIEYKEKPLLAVYIQESSTKPVHLKNKGIEDSFVRIGGTTRKISRQEIGDLLLNNKQPHWEELHVSNLLASKTILELLDYHTIHQLLKRPIPETESEILNWMKRENFIKPFNEGYYITNLGAISSAKKLSDFDRLSRKAIRVIKYDGVSKIVTQHEMEVVQ